MLECFLSGFCPSSREDLEGTQENLNALLKHSLSGFQAVKRSTKVRGLDTNRNSSWTSFCDIVPTIPATFYCVAHGQDIRFQANDTTNQVRSFGLLLGPTVHVSVEIRLKCNIKPR